MTSGHSPPVARLDPDEGATADFWDRLLGGAAGPVVILLLADEAGRASGWAARAALTLADALAHRYGSGTVVDLQLDAPALHRAAGLRNEDGIADVLLFGASLEHVARPVVGGSARLVPVGPFVPDTAEVLESAGWGRVLEEATADGGGVLLYAPLERPPGTLGAKADRVVLLCGVAEHAASLVPEGLDVACIVTPPPVRPQPVPEADEQEDQLPVVTPRELVAPTTDAPTAVAFEPGEPGIANDERDAATAERERKALIADLRGRQEAALAGAAAARSEPRRAIPPREQAKQDSARRGIPEPPPSHREKAPQPRKRLPVMFVTLLVLALAAALAGFWHYFGREYLASRNASQATPVADPAGTEPRPVGDPLPYSVAIEAHPDLPTAVERVDRLAVAEPGIGFYIAPVLMDSVLFYRVMAGPLPDSATAAAITDTLLAKGHKTGASAWDIRSTPLTFLLGEFATREEADARMDELRRLDIPSYVVELPYSSGPPRFRLYSGAYAGPAEADVMRQFLQNVGLADTLVLRTGRSAS